MPEVEVNAGTKIGSGMGKQLLQLEPAGKVSLRR